MPEEPRRHTTNAKGRPQKSANWCVEEALAYFERQSFELGPRRAPSGSRQWARIVGLVLGLACLFGQITGCKQRSTAGSERKNTTRATAGAQLALPALQAENWLVELPVPGFESAWVAIPRGALEPRPIIIALHGSSDRAQWQCGTWFGIAAAKAFVLCPSGSRRPDSSATDARYTWASSEALRSELRAALKALKAQYSQYLVKGSVVLAGFELGAELAAELIREEPAFFSRVVLVSGGTEAWTPTFSELFAAAGGKRVLLVCTAQNCREPSLTRALFIRRSGARAQAEYLGELGPVLDERVAKAIKARWQWLLEEDPSKPTEGTATALH